jgi:CBS domain-containing protein
VIVGRVFTLNINKQKRSKAMLLHDWILSTKVNDIMVRKLATVRPDQTLSEAAAMMLSEQISGLPVVDLDGVCRGVFSVTDILRAEEKVAEQQWAISSTFFSSNLTLPDSVYVEKLEQVRDKLSPAAEQTVEHFMTTDLVSVSTEDSLKEIVQSMVDAHLHRVLVIDQDQRLQGIITTTDVLAVLLRDSREGDMSSETRRLHEQHSS